MSKMRFNRGSGKTWNSRDDLKNSAPHKPVLMLAVIKMFNLNKYDTGDQRGIYHLDQELVDHFEQISEIIMASGIDIVLPYFHLKNEKDGYWHHSWVGGHDNDQKPTSKQDMFNRYVGVRFSLFLSEKLRNNQRRLELANGIINENFDFKYMQPLMNYLGFSPEKGNGNTPHADSFIPDFDEIEKELDEFIIQDARSKQLKEISSRKGQGTFRENILRIYNKTCCITGSKVEAVLEAAHIIPYNGEISNHVQNGLLLRSDIHTLYDSGKLVINPENMHVILHSDLYESEYTSYAGKPIRLPNDKLHQPSKKALDHHRIMCSQWWYYIQD